MVNLIKIFLVTLKYRFDNRYRFDYIDKKLIIIDLYSGSFGEDFIIYNSEEIIK